MDANLRVELMQTMLRLKMLHGAFHHAEGFNMSDAVILRAIEHKGTGDGGPADYTALIQKQLHISKPAISQKLTALEEKGLITRTINREDRRRFDFALTQAGYDLAAQMQQRMGEGVAQLLERMGEDDLREFIRLLDKLAKIVEEYSQEQTLENLESDCEGGPCGC